MNTCPRIAIVPWLAAAAASQQYPVWTQIHVSGPSARTGHSMAYDAARSEIVLFGGSINGTRLAETWIWNGNAWTQRAVAGPAAREQSAMAFDRARQQTILFGGRHVTGSAETWAWDGTTWSLLSPAQSPVGRWGHGLVYDEARQRIVLFGGQALTLNYLADTWEWNGAIWAPRPSAHTPSLRGSHGMAYDAARGESVMFGGINSTTLFDDTWTWNGVDWLQRTPVVRPRERAMMSLAYFASRQFVIEFHGFTSSSFADTWYWDGTSWIERSRSSGTPDGRRGYGWAYDEQRDELIMFGGTTESSGIGADTWRMTIPGLAGSFQAFGVGCGSPLALAASVGSVPRIGRTFDAVLSAIPAGATSAFMTLGFSNTFVGPFPLPLQLDFAGMNGCSLYHDLQQLNLPVVQNGATATWTLAIPNSQALIGTHAFVQGAAAVPGANPAGLIASNAGELVVGT
jgi:hypothetical protein